MKKIILTITTAIAVLCSSASYAKNDGGSSSHGLTEVGVGHNVVKFDPEVDFALFAKSGGFERITANIGDKAGNGRKGNGVERGLFSKGDKGGNGRKDGGVERGIF